MSACALRGEKRAFPIIPPFCSPWLSLLIRQDYVLERGGRGCTLLGWYRVNFLHNSLYTCCLPGLIHGRGKSSSSSRLPLCSHTPFSSPGKSRCLHLTAGGSSLGSTVGWDEAPHASSSQRAAVHEEGLERLIFKSPLGHSLLSPK